MRKIIQLTTIAVLLISSVITINSCKKGSEDPLISLRSRKARLVGEWKMTTGTVDKLSSSGTITTEAYNGSTKVTTQGSDVTTQDFSHEINFAKDGTFTQTVVEKTTNTFGSGSFSSTTVTTTTTTNMGNWNFLHGQGEAKNKEYVFLTETSSKQNQVDVVTTNIPGQSNSTTTTNTSDSGIQSFGSTWKLVELKNKEIKFTTTSEYTYVNNAGVSSTSKSNSNFTLTAK